MRLAEAQRDALQRMANGVRFIWRPEETPAWCASDGGPGPGDEFYPLRYWGFVELLHDEWGWPDEYVITRAGREALESSHARENHST